MLGFSGMARNAFHKYGGAGKKQYEKEQEEKKKKSPTKPFEDAAKATEGLRENLRRMGERKKKEDEEKKKKKEGGVGPKSNFMERMYNKSMSNFIRKPENIMGSRG